MNKKVSIVVPAHNEEENITDVINKIEEIIDIDHQLVIVNDHSQDKTAEIVNQLAKHYNSIKLVENDLDKGFANALRTGFKEASGEFIVPVMGDLCDDLFTIKKMLEQTNHGFDVVCGSRYVKDGARLGGSGLKAFFSSFVGKSLQFILRLPTHDITNAFKLYKKEILDRITIESKAYEISMEIPLKAYYLGYKITEVPTIWKERTKGKSGFNMFKLLPNYLKLYIWAIVKRIFNRKCHCSQ